MNTVSKHAILSNRSKFVLLLISIYIAVATIASPYNVLPSLSICSMVPLSVFLISYPTYHLLLPRFNADYKRKANIYYFILLSLLLIVSVIVLVRIYICLLYNVFDLPRENFPESI
jgi:hypothetical protein